MTRVACIGSRALNDEALVLLERIGEYLAKNDYTVVSGNAPGADQAYARGANKVDPTLVELHLPWATYEKDAIVPGNRVSWKLDKTNFQTAGEYHPVWDRIRNQGTRKLLARNVRIVRGTAQVIAWPSPRPGGGGTGHAIRVAKALGNTHHRPFNQTRTTARAGQTGRTGTITEESQLPNWRNNR